jgi:nitroreductase
MQKPADNKYPIHDLLKQRWSPRAFSSQPVETEKLQSLLEAARWSASCFNDQPWRFIVAVEPEEREKMLGCYIASVQRWAVHAPVLMLTVAHKTFEGYDTPNRHAWHDIGLATQNLTVQATSMGLFVHPVAGIEADKAREVYHIPADFDPVTGIILGYPGELSTLVEKDQVKETQERTRKPLSDIVFSGDWGQSAPFVKD